jgi:hypothetical protein
MARKRRKWGWGGARPGSGPKPIFAERVMRSISFERESRDAVQRLADERGISFAEVVRRAVDEYLKRSGRK